MSLNNESGAAPSPCPPWCVIDHAKGVKAHQGTPREVPPFYARLIAPVNGAPEVLVSSWGTSGSIFVQPRRADDVARLIEALATASPAEHQALANGIRQAAADAGSES